MGRQMKNIRKYKRRRKRRFLRAILILLWILSILFAMGLVYLILNQFLGFQIRDIYFRLPIQKVDIVLDPGHGGKDPGANMEDVIEKEITQEIANQAKLLLEDAGYRVFVTRDSDVFLDLSERSNMANKREAKVFVSIHCNSSEDGEGSGIETFYTEQKSEASKVLAENLQQCIIEETDAKDRDVKTADYTVLVKTEMPSALVEVGFLTDDLERQLLTNGEYQEKLAEGIAKGIDLYLSAKIDGME